MHNDLGEIKNVTTDWKRALPGTVYFDFTDRRRRKEIVNAFKNGASRIYTEKNISDPDMPVEKVNDLNNIFISSLTDFHKELIKNVNLIAIGGSKGKTSVSKLLEIIFTGEANYSKYFYNKKSFNSNPLKKRLEDAKGLEETYNYITNMRSKGILNAPVIIDINNDFFSFNDYFDFDCGILTNIIKEGCGANELEVQRYKQIFSSIKNNKPIIANIDHPNTLEILKDNKKNIVITYGLNKKAAVTATSIDINSDLSFNYCLQRNIHTYNDKIIEPFEVPLTLKAAGNHNIYNSLAAVTCALFYEIPIEDIRESLKNFNGIFRRFEKIQCEKFTIIDQYCNNIVDYITAFDSLQTVDYNNLYVICSVRTDIDKNEHFKIINILKDWSDILNIKKVNITSCLDVINRFEFEPKSDVRLYKKELKNIGISYDYYVNLYECINDMFSCISNGDLLLILGGEEMNMCQTIILN